MKTVWFLLSALVAAPVCLGADRCYLDPANEVVRREELSSPAKPLLLKVTLEVMSGGKSIGLASSANSHFVGLAQLLRQTGLILPSDAGEDGSFAVTTNLLSDETKSWTRRSGPGRTSRQAIESTVAITTGGTSTMKKYESAYICFEGRAEEPENIGAPINGPAIIEALCEQSWLRALRDLQREGVFP